ncbi:LysM peptidoglycan-binding domain-containing protein [Thermomicrobiaceae bacterium CFH 74404]|uniref:LysM peptidoglycan-binding domain-containing protein n=1 Tax=Thermalbibacter longus TaxID=2951981 RepID=A0AA42BAM2_9BACT|nr:LysM domain-containing protein [Thermalbibacter longus]MCM8748784.1 LysM peptidoglycan-binding domain-containing protein [Thermalbibacter longus]
MGRQGSAPDAWRALRWVRLLLCGLLTASCLGLSEPEATPTPSATPTPTSPVMLEIVTPTPGPAVNPSATPTAVPEGNSTPEGSQPSGETPTSYVVQPGDTLFGIAAKFNVDVQALIDANNISDPNTLQAGQVLVIPTPQGQGQ